MHHVAIVLVMLALEADRVPVTHERPTVRYSWPAMRSRPVAGCKDVAFWGVAEFATGDSVLNRWEWRGDSLIQLSATRMNGSSFGAPIGADRFLAEIDRDVAFRQGRKVEAGLWIRDINSGRDLAVWPSGGKGAPQRKTRSICASSKNGGVIAEAADEAAAEPGRLVEIDNEVVYYPGSPNCFVCFALYDVNDGVLKWVGRVEVPVSSYGTFPVPADSGKYIGCAPLSKLDKRGAGMLESSTGKLLWSRGQDDLDVWGITCGCFSNEESAFFVGGRSGQVTALDTKTGKVLSRWAATKTGEPKRDFFSGTDPVLANITAMAITKDGEYLAVARGALDGAVYVRHQRTGHVTRLYHDSLGVSAIAFSPDSNNLATVGGRSEKGSTIYVWSRSIWQQR